LGQPLRDSWWDKQVRPRCPMLFYFMILRLLNGSGVPFSFAAQFFHDLFGYCFQFPLVHLGHPGQGEFLIMGPDLNVLRPLVGGDAFAVLRNLFGG
jgi:hypothetical protein